MASTAAAVFSVLRYPFALIARKARARPYLALLLAFTAVMAVLPEAIMLPLFIASVMAAGSSLLPALAFTSPRGIAMVIAVAWISVYLIALHHGGSLRRRRTHLAVLAWTALVAVPGVYLLRIPVIWVGMACVKGFIWVFEAAVFLPMMLVFGAAGWALWTAVARGLSRLGAAVGPVSCKAGRVVSIMLAIGLPATLVPLAVNDRVMAAADALRAGDRDSPPFESLPSAVLLRLPSMQTGRSLQCDGLCLRLLYNDAVERVIVMRNDEVWQPGTRRLLAAAYRIEARDTSPAPAIGETDTIWASDGAQRRMLRERVLERIAAGECLVRERGDPNDAPMTVQVEERHGVFPDRGDKWRPYTAPKLLRRLTVLMDGDVRFRRTVVVAWKSTLPLGFARKGFFRVRHEFGEMDLYGRDILPGLFGDAVGPIEPA